MIKHQYTGLNRLLLDPRRKGVTFEQDLKKEKKRKREAVQWVNVIVIHAW